MRYGLIALVLMAVPLPAHAQLAVVPKPVDTSTLATKSEVQSAQAAAAAACQPMAAIPPTETPGGSAGSGLNCRLVNSVQPRITRATVGTTNASGVVTVTWATPLDAVPIIVPVPMVASSASQVPICAPVQGTVTVSGSQVKCFTTQSVTVSILGAVVAPITTAASGLSVQVFAVPTTP